MLLVAGFAPANVDAARDERGQQNQCVPQRTLVNFNNLHQVEAQGFFADLYGNASILFEREHRQKYVSLDLDVDAESTYVASRITEIDEALPADERVKCWQATADKNVVVEYTLRFEQAAVPMLTENAMLWNAPFSPEGIVPISAVGVTRNQFSGGYMAVVAQEFDFVASGIYALAPIPGWVDPTAWHDIRLTVTQTSALVEVAQGETTYTPVLEVALPEPLEPLAFQFSVDNEMFPSVFAPVFQPDAMDVAYLNIRAR
jgi:hypothetical protein